MSRNDHYSEYYKSMKVVYHENIDDGSTSLDIAGRWMHSKNNPVHAHHCNNDGRIMIDTMRRRKR